ncbi:hypothetical protein [Methanobacterium formicicum]|uniref:hypothetical protein n=1 Tax=Methanobacterium formicicum TaxID=2162 RepID=UPI002412BBD6|nr:hypothetical protein [Methanobacterium formicicum]MDG3547444.1 hypothetical protein [Methanobacterium formicicum]
MAKFKLTPYIIRIRQKRSTEFLILDDLDITNESSSGDSGIDLFDVLKNFFETNDKIIDEDLKKTLYINDDQIEYEERSIFGTIRSGEYGYNADFLNINTLDRVQDARTEDDSEDYPFVFFLNIPRNKNYGILILQTFKTIRIKTILEKALIEHIGGVSDYDLTIKFNPLISSDLLEKLENASKVIDVEFVRHDVPRDPFERYHNTQNEDGMNREELTERRIFTPKRNKNINVDGLKSFLRTIQNRDIEYFEILGENYDEIKIQVDINGSRTTLTMGTFNKIRESLPLPTDFPLDKGFPRYTNLITLMRRYIFTEIIPKLEGER